MFFIITYCVIVVFFGCLASSGIMKHGLKVAFLLIILFSAFRFNYGNDYAEYYARHQSIAKIPSLQTLLGHFDSPFDKYQGVELGWTLLNWLFKTFGFEVLIICTSIFTNVVYYKFIKTIVPRKWYWLALFTYIFNPSLFFVPLSMMRQSLGMALFVFSFKYIYDKKLIIATLLIFLASLFHKSGIILLPLVLLGYTNSLSGKKLAFLFGGSFIALLFVQNLTTTLVESALTVESLEDYGDYFDNPDFEAADSFGLGFAIRLITLFIPLLFFFSDIKQPFSARLASLIAGFSFLIAPFTQVLGFIGRISYYFSIYTIVATPVIYNWITNKIVLYGLLALYIAYTLLAYLNFFRDPNWVYFTHYHTIFG